MAKTWEAFYRKAVVSQILREDLRSLTFKGIVKPFRLFSQVLLLLSLVMVCAAGSSKPPYGSTSYGPVRHRPIWPWPPAQHQVNTQGSRLDAAIHDNELPSCVTDPKAVSAVRPRLPAPNVDFGASSLRAQTCLVTASWPQGDKSGVHSGVRVLQKPFRTVRVRQRYNGVTKKVQDVADRCADLMKALTGHGDFFLAARLRENSGRTS